MVKSGLFLLTRIIRSVHPLSEPFRSVNLLSFGPKKSPFAKRKGS